MSLLRFVAPFFVAGAIVSAGRVVEAAPIIRWMTGKTPEDVIPYARRRGWTVQVMR